MKVLVTGASGHLATNTILQLVERGYSVAAYLRNKNKFLLAEGKNIEVIEGDYEPDDLDKAMRDCEFVVHTAAESSQGKVRYRYYEKVNVELTLKICAAAVRQGVRRMIYVSTANVFAYGSKDVPGDESKPSKPPFTRSQYVISKRIAQEHVLSYQDKMEVIILNPSFMIGPYDQKPGSNILVLMGMKRKVLFYPPGGKSFVHVKDASAAIVNSLLRGKNGECYLLAHENISYKEFFAMLGRSLNKKIKLIRLPFFVMILLGILGELLKLLGINNSLFMTNVGIVRTNNYYTGKKAQKELGITYRPILSAIEDSSSWLKSHHFEDY